MAKTSKKAPVHKADAEREYFDNMLGFAEGDSIRRLCKSLANLSVGATRIATDIGNTGEGTAYHREMVADFANSVADCAKTLFTKLVSSSQYTSNPTYEAIIQGYKLTDEDIAGYCIDNWIDD